jgi:hypothetical protein
VINEQSQRLQQAIPFLQILRTFLRIRLAKSLKSLKQRHHARQSTKARDSCLATSTYNASH